jgi:hypothetical protein
MIIRSIMMSFQRSLNFRFASESARDLREARVEDVENSAKNAPVDVRQRPSHDGEMDWAT